MLYTGYIYLADNVTYVCVHCSCYHKSVVTHEHHSLQQPISSRIGYLVDLPVWLLLKWHTCNCLGKTGMFCPKLLITFLSLSILGQIDWHALGNSQDRLALH